MTLRRRARHFPRVDQQSKLSQLKSSQCNEKQIFKCFIILGRMKETRSKFVYCRTFRSCSAHKKALAVLSENENVHSNLRDAMVLQPDDFGHADATGGNVNNTEEGDHFQDFVVKALRRKHRVLLRRAPKVDAARVAEAITWNLINFYKLKLISVAISIQRFNGDRVEKIDQFGEHLK